MYVCLPSVHELLFTCFTVCRNTLPHSSLLFSQGSTRWGTWSTGSPGGTPPCCRTRRWRPSVAPCTRSPAKTWRTPRPSPTRAASRSWSTSPRAEETGGLQQCVFVQTLLSESAEDTHKQTLANMCTCSNALLKHTKRMDCTHCPGHWRVGDLHNILHFQAHTHTDIEMLREGEAVAKGKSVLCALRFFVPVE